MQIGFTNSWMGLLGREAREPECRERCLADPDGDQNNAEVIVGVDSLYAFPKSEYSR